MKMKEKIKEAEMISINPFDIIEITTKVFLALSPVIIAAIIYKKSA